MIEKGIARYFKKLRVGAKRRGLSVGVTPEYLLQIFELQGGKCAITGLPITFKWGRGTTQTASLDRIDNAGGYLPANVQWVHKDINKMRGSLELERFLELCNLVSKNNEFTHG